MTIRVALTHETTYGFDRAVSLSPHEIRLRPAPHCRTPINSYSLTVAPKHFINWQQDPFGNWVARLVFPDKATELKVTVDLVADMTVINPFDFFVEKYAESFPFEYPDALRKELQPFLETEEPGPLLSGWLAAFRREVLTGKLAIVDMLVAVNSRLQGNIGYIVRMEPGIQACDETLSLRRGSCRDSAWLLVQIFRRLGLAARFASGYLIQLTADVKALDGPQGPARDFTDLPACTAAPSSAAPVIGFTDKSEVRFGFHMNVTRIHEDPRVTLPYSEKDWTDIDVLARKVDAQLSAWDVRLTMGGEPTFVSIDDMDADVSVARGWQAVVEGRRPAGR